MTKHLFLFTITPVQSFVMQARKAQDFHVASRILSNLTASALNEAVALNPECDIIFPHPDIDSMPNRFMAIVENDDINKFGENLKKHVENDFKNQVDEAFKDIFDNQPPLNYEFQRDNYLSISWAATEYDSNNYQQKYKELESILGGTKNIRSFLQLPETEKGRKCSLCGERNAIVFIDKKLHGFQKDSVLIPPNSKNFYLMKLGEGLCTICGFKRFSKVGGSYKSTSDIALLHTIADINKKKEEIKEEKIKEGEYDPQYLVMLKEESYDKKEFEHLDYSLKEKTEKLSKFIKDHEIPLTPYYALMAFDGDSMGETLGGGKLKAGEDLKTFQQELSKHLGNFAKAVCSEIKKDEGQVVFAGGEDFLGFVNLNSLFSVMQRLRTLFDEKVHGELAEKLESDKKLSFSAGIVVAHVKTPLATVIGMSREMEKVAKEIEGKDSFAIAVMKHSGEINQASFKWKDKNGYFLTDAVSNLTEKIEKNNLSSTFMSFLEKEFSPIMSKEGIVEISVVKNTNFKEMLQNELKRTLKRSIQQGNAEKKEKKYKEIVPWIETMINNSTEKTAIEEIKLSNLFNVFHIIDFMARERGGNDEN